MTNVNLLNGNKLYQTRARLVLPLLVQLAKAGKHTTYSGLADEVEMPNPRNLNYVLGAIGDALKELSKQANTHIPDLTCLVLKKTNGLPGNGASAFKSKINFAQLTNTQKENIVKGLLIDICAYQEWDWVLNELGLVPLTALTVDDLAGAGNTGGGGESQEHRLFKEYIASHPQLIGLKGIDNVKTEVALASGDRLDVAFIQDKLIIAVEVKSIRSNRLDIIRGLFQCVKYKHVVEAEQAVRNEYPNCRVILALQSSLPSDLNLTRSILGIEVIDNISMV
jgi:hypothetical protein